jgi:hypothetical protein
MNKLPKTSGILSEKSKTYTLNEPPQTAEQCEGKKEK